VSIYINKNRDYQRNAGIILSGSGSARGGGFVLLITLVVLLVLAAVGYNFASRVAAYRHRNNYVIDYAIAGYARDSALKYALATLQDLNDIELVSRPNEPDFSDLFAMQESDYRKVLEWAEDIISSKSQFYGVAGLVTNTIAGLGENSSLADITYEPNDLIGQLRIRGPYGPTWPFVTEPVEFEIGQVKVKLEVEDENAKYPAGWALVDDIRVRREADAGLETFCEWMGYDYDRIDSLKEQLKEVGSIKPFKTEFKPIVRREEVTPQRRRVVRGRRRVVAGRAVFRTVTIQPAEQIIGQARDFSKLFHSSLIDIETLARPTILSEDRKESALKYMGLWGTTQVNINSAPRNVLEAAFTFGGDAEKIADEIIRIRREKPFENVEDLERRLFRYSDSIEKCRPYITTASNVFAVHITARSGSAEASAVIIVYKDGKKFQQIAVFCG
jgi:hypothetical protein